MASPFERYRPRRLKTSSARKRQSPPSSGFGGSFATRIWRILRIRLRPFEKRTSIRSSLTLHFLAKGIYESLQ
jgi:hypothetical protein